MDRESISPVAAAAPTSRTLLPLALILLLGTASIAGLLVYFSNALYQHTLETLSERVSIALRHESGLLAELAMDYSYWDVGYQKLISEPDPLWADDNIGTYIHEYVHVDLSLAVNAGGKVIFAFRDGKPADVMISDLLESGLARMLGDEQAVRQPGEGEDGVVRFANTMYVAGVNSFTIDYETEFEDGSYLVLAKAIDQDFLDRIADQYQIPGLRTVAESDAIPGLNLPVFDVHEGRIGTLAWDDPGSAKLLGFQLAWLLASIAVAMCLLALWVVRIELDRQRQYHESLSRMALRDWLTDADNRRGFFEKAQQELLRSKSRGVASTLLLLDVDDFKSVNDQFGHACGDTTLVQLTKCLRTELRTYDLLARVGGEEFAILLPQTELDVAQRVAKRLLLAASATHETLPEDQQLPSITVSIGIARWHPDETLDSLMERADKALYAAKAGGRNRWVLAEEPDQEIPEFSGQIS